MDISSKRNVQGTDIRSESNVQGTGIRIERNGIERNVRTFLFVLKVYSIHPLIRIKVFLLTLTGGQGVTMSVCLSGPSLQFIFFFLAQIVFKGLQVVNKTSSSSL